VAHVDDLLQTPTHLGASQGQGQLQGFADEVLSALFAVKPQLCNQKFELKLNDVRFVSHLIVDVLSTIFTRFAHNFPLLRN